MNKRPNDSEVILRWNSPVILPRGLIRGFLLNVDELRTSLQLDVADHIDVCTLRISDSTMGEQIGSPYCLVGSSS